MNDIEDQLTSHIKHALNNAKDNGYDFKGWTAKQIAKDMCQFDSYLEEYSVEAVESELNIILTQTNSEAG